MFRRLPVSGTDGIEMLLGILFERNPRMLVTTFCGDPDAAPKSEPPNFVNRADGDDDSPELLFSSCDATVSASLYNREWNFFFYNNFFSKLLAFSFFLAQKFFFSYYFLANFFLQQQNFFLAFLYFWFAFLFN